MFKNYLRHLIPRSFRSLIVASLTLLITQPVQIQGFNNPNTFLAAPGFQQSGRFVSTSNPQVPRAYLPLIFYRVGAGIFGFVTQAGLPVNNVSLTLRKLVGSTSQDLAITTTNGDGYYQFLDQDPLSSGQYYQVIYNNLSLSDPIPGRLAWWKTKMVTPSLKGQWIPIGNFDIADIVLGDPPDGNKLPLPVTFNWTRRVKSPSDSYLLRILLYEPPTYTDKYLSPPSGYVGSITFSKAQWPSTLIYDTVVYIWLIMVEAPDTASGESHSMHYITFQATP